MDKYTEISLILLGVIIVHLLILYFLTRKSKNIKGRTVVVTGGSSGIGLWVAINCVKLGAHVTIIARNVNLLGKVFKFCIIFITINLFNFLKEKAVQAIGKHRVNENQKISYKSIDLSKDYDNITKQLEKIEEESGEIYMLVNCAGMAICGTVEEMSIEDAKLMMDINYFATYYPTRYVLPKMKARGDGIIVITASQAALLGIYGYGAYAASKFALRGLAETIAMESKHRGVSVTLALPADTDTPGFEREEKTKPEETKIISGSGGLAKPEAVAKQIIKDALVSSVIFKYFQFNV